MFDEKKLKFYDITCTENEDDSLKCAATLLIPANIDIKQDEITGKLKSYCISKDQLFLNSSNDSCVYLWKKTKNEGYQITIERKVNSIISIDSYDVSFNLNSEFKMIFFLNSIIDLSIKTVRFVSQFKL